VFSEKYLVEGEKGGKEAATDLKQHLMKEFGGAGSLCTMLYMNMTGLRDYLVSKNVCSTWAFDGFVTGFNRSTELFSIVDCSQGKEAADAKIRGAPSPSFESLRNLTCLCLLSPHQKCSKPLLAFRK
jgi:hypothetical protein